MAVAFGFSAASGAFFGCYPAPQAPRLSTIVVRRYE
jgi:hypothetical protein